MIILTHPCAGKTYWSKKRPDIIGDPGINCIEFIKKYNYVCVRHKANEYDAAIALDDEMLEAYLRRRTKAGGKKRYNNIKQLRECRDEVIEIAKQNRLPLYKSIPEFLKAHNEKPV